MKIMITYLVIINAVAFLLMLIDKIKAVKGAWRIPENVLLGAAVIGGSLGTFISMHVFWHKTRHIRFTCGVPVIMFIQVLLIMLYFKLTTATG